MVAFNEIKAANALISDANAPRVAVFVGGTSGIGRYTARALACTGAGVRIYIVGRKSAEERTRAFIDETRSLNPRARVVWVEGEIALLADVKRICEVIKSRESRVDLLFLTAGYGPVGAREETAEGFEITMSLSYYSRMLFIMQLLPLLNVAESARVISVLGGGLERTSSIVLDDMDLRSPKNFGLVKGQTHYGALNTVTMDKMASLNPNVTFIHSWPGWVPTGNVNRGYGPDSKWAWFVWLFLERFISTFGYSQEESGQRYLFQSTSAAFGGRGTPWNGKAGLNTTNEPKNGMFLVNFRCDCTPNAKVVASLRETAQTRVWDHLQQVLGPHL